MKTTITSATFILIFSVASVSTLHAQSVKKQTTDTSLSSSDNTPSRRIAAVHSIHNSTRVFDTTLDFAGLAAVRRAERASSETQHKDISVRQRTEYVGTYSTSGPNPDSTKISTGMVDAQ